MKRYRAQHRHTISWKLLVEEQPYLGETPDLFDRHVEPEEIQRFAPHRRQVAHAHGLLLSKRQVLVHPHLALGLLAQLVQAGDLLTGDGGGAGLLQEDRLGVCERMKEWDPARGCGSATFLDSVLGVPSTLLFIFWAGFIFSIPNSELGAIPASPGHKHGEWKRSEQLGGANLEPGSPGLLLAMLAPIGYGPGPPWFIIPCMLFMPGPYGEPAPIMPWDMFG